jgi:hypothetical protein
MSGLAPNSRRNRAKSALSGRAMSRHCAPRSIKAQRPGGREVGGRGRIAIPRLRVRLPGLEPLLLGPRL